MEPQKQHQDQEMEGKGKPAEPGKKNGFTVGPGSNQCNKMSHNRRKQVLQRSHELQEKIPNTQKALSPNNINAKW